MSPGLFDHYIGIDYSGAGTPLSSLTGLRVYVADRVSPPVEIHPPAGPRRYWTRRGLAAWLSERLNSPVPAIVGIDHALSFPLRYFEVHGLGSDWPTFLDDFCRHWPTDEDHVCVDFVRDGLCGNGAARSGNSKWRRRTEVRAGSAKSVFHFDVPGSVAKSTHAGLPWIRRLRELRERVHFWPFDGWQVDPSGTVIAEVYPSLVRAGFPREDRTADQHDAYAVAAWMRRADLSGDLGSFLEPPLTAEERALAAFEGWILGIR